MASHFLDISAALDSRLNSMTSKPPIAWENKEYVPIVGTLYLRPTNMPADTLAETERDITTGVYQIDIFSEAGYGKNESLLMADRLADQFKQDSELTYNGVTVRVKSVSGMFIASNEDGWHHRAVKVSWYAFTARRT